MVLILSEVIDKATKNHESRYGYDKVKENYVNMNTKVQIFCYACKKYFLQKMVKHVTCGQGCEKCERKRAGIKKSFPWEKLEPRIFQSHPKGYYGYEKAKENYVNTNTKVPIYCYSCKKYFLQSITDHISYGCNDCGNRLTALKKIIPWEQLQPRIYEVHPKGNFGYDKAKENYVNTRTKVPIYCYSCKKYFLQKISNHIYGRQGCPECKCLNKTEIMLKEILDQNFNYEIIREQMFEWCKKKKKLRFDFVIEELKCIIELDGRQHFEQVRDWKSPEEQLKDDTFKNNKAIENGYSMIRVLQEDIFKNKPDIILKLILSIHRYRIPQLICIGEIYRDWFNIENLTLLI
jgi:very-short-patch-repair endonuclease